MVRLRTSILGSWNYHWHLWYIYQHDWVILGKGKCWCAYSSTMVRIWENKKTMDIIEQLYIAGWWFGTMEFYDFPYIGNKNPNWRTHIFQRGRYTTNQYILCIQNLLFCWKIFCIQILNWCLIGRSMLIGSSPDSDKIEHWTTCFIQRTADFDTQFWGFWADTVPTSTVALLGTKRWNHRRLAIRSTKDHGEFSHPPARRGHSLGLILGLCSGLVG